MTYHSFDGSVQGNPNSSAVGVGFIAAFSRKSNTLMSDSKESVEFRKRRHCEEAFDSVEHFG